MTTATLPAMMMSGTTTASVSHSRAAAALMSLMNYYEQDSAVEESGESETELMVLLSGMVGVDTSALHGE